jgi:hypothetical protein
MVQYPLCEIAAGKHEARQQVQFITMDMSGAIFHLPKGFFQTLKSFLIVSTLFSTLVEP